MAKKEMEQERPESGPGSCALLACELGEFVSDPMTDASGCADELMAFLVRQHKKQHVGCTEAV
jgi:hypothetical protein